MEVILSYLAVQEEIQFLIAQKCCFTSAAVPSIAQSSLCYVRIRYETSMGRVVPFKECILPVDESLRFVVTEVYEFLLEHKLF
jgi:hypothetical protein